MKDNINEQEKRLVKSIAMATELRRGRVPSVLVEKFTDEQWKIVAKYAKVLPPHSEETKLAVLALLRSQEEQAQQAVNYVNGGSGFRYFALKVEALEYASKLADTGVIARISKRVSGYSVMTVQEVEE